MTGDYRPEKIGSKIRDAQLELIPYMLVVGGREMETGAVAVRDRIEGDMGSLTLDEAIAKLQAEVAGKGRSSGGRPLAHRRLGRAGGRVPSRPKTMLINPGAAAARRPDGVRLAFFSLFRPFYRVGPPHRPLGGPPGAPLC